MKTLLERTIQYGILAFSTALSVGFLAPFVQQSYPAVDDKILVPLTTGLIYIAFLAVVSIMVRLPFVNGLVDSNSRFTGTFLSFERNPAGPAQFDNLGIFKISFSAWKRKYRLEGVSYSISKMREIGNWHSENLQMNPDSGIVSYIYDGSAESHLAVDGSYTESASLESQGGFDGYGYARIRFALPAIEFGSGHFVDDRKSPSRVDSRYRRLTRDLAREIGDDGRRLSGSNWRRTVECFNKLSPEVRRKFYM